MHNSKNIRVLLLLGALCIVHCALCISCASVGRPDGGPRDEDPPVFVRSNPLPAALNVSHNKITIDFDENVQLDDPTNKVVVSPAQKQQPVISSNGRRVTVELRDTLLPNTTYVIDFADAIKDLNEGNVLDGFAIDFSTGETIDSLRISGMVLAAENLEPAQGMLVGAYYDRGDTAITTLPFDRITKTNQYGQFTLRGLRPGEYAVYALTDNNRDLHWDRSEDVAFLGSLVVPSTEQIMVNDTIRNAETFAVDSIVQRPGVRYLPNDVLLTWFNENYLPQYLKDYSRPERRKLTFILGAPTDSLPVIRIASEPFGGAAAEDWGVLIANERGDSINWWIRDRQVMALDTLMIEATYQRLDSTERLVWKTDTLRMNFREPKKKEEKKKKKKDEEADTLAADTVPKIEFAKIELSNGATIDIPSPLIIKSETPIERFDSAAVRLEMMVDTLWTPVPPPRFRYPSARNSMQLVAAYTWEPGGKYRLQVDSASIVDIYGLHNKPISHEFTVKTEDEYSQLYFVVTGTSEPMMVELLNGQDNVVRRSPVVNGEAAFEYLNPGTYYARLFIDANRNGQWDTGALLDSVQPEEVYYYPKALNLKKNWDVEQNWNIYEMALDLQKPAAIKKNKPKLKPGEQQPEDENEEEEEGIPNPNYNPFDPNSKKYLDNSYSGSR